MTVINRKGSIAMIPDVLYEDNHLIAVNKPAGILSQQDYTGEPSLLEMVKDYVKEKYNKPGNVFIGLVHRLDRPVSGTMVFARTSKAAKRLSEQFREKDSEKIYCAAVSTPGRHVWNENDAGLWIPLEQEMERRGDRSVIVKEKTSSSQRCILEYTPVLFSKGEALLLVRLITGRKHQIRAQLSSIGMPVIGDRHYGGAPLRDTEAICLHAFSLRIIHPTTREPMEFRSPVPRCISERFHEYEDLDGVLGECI
ncbi:MAG TPA: RluA family pseudouridine synthase [Spirochaetota bacterium]|nr:RluA family pseudouridine synthase [Spirochaetota bacterium]